jgi:hypothetical protein
MSHISFLHNKLFLREMNNHFDFEHDVQKGLRWTDKNQKFV